MGCLGHGWGERRAALVWFSPRAPRVSCAHCALDALLHSKARASMAHDDGDDEVRNGARENAAVRKESKAGCQRPH
jgi:hypothetical protein